MCIKVYLIHFSSYGIYGNNVPFKYSEILMFPVCHSVPPTYHQIGIENFAGHIVLPNCQGRNDSTTNCSDSP